MGGFVQRHRTAIVAAVATVAAGATAAGAYYYYRSLQDEQDQELDRSGDEHKKAKSKKNKKKSKKKTGGNGNNADAIEYPVLENGEPDFVKIKSMEQSHIENFATVLKDKGNSFFKEKKFDDALVYYNYALELKKDPIYYSNISACYVSMNQLDKVIENTTKALELKPDYSKALLRRASAYESLEQYSDAMFDLSVLSLNNDFSGASIEPMLERNLNKQAMKVLKDKMESTTATATTNPEQGLPSNTSMASFFGIFKKELTFNNFNENDKNDQILKDSLTKLYSATNDGYLLADKNFTKVCENYTNLYEKNNNNNQELKEKLAIALEYVGIFKFLKNDLINAQIDIKKAIDLFPRVNSYIYMALTMADKGDNQEYFTYFEKALELDPNCSATYYHRGQLYFITQNYEMAKKDFLKSKELDESNIFPYIQLACLDYREGNFEDCKKQFDQTRDKFPVAPEVPTFYAEILADKEDFAEASKQYDFARRLEETQNCIHVGVAPLVGKATVLARQPSAENFKEATKLLEEACKKDSRSEQAKVGLAQLKLQEEDVDTAIRLFEESADLARTIEEKLQATTFAEAAKVQKKIRADPVIRAKVEKTLAEYRAQGMI